MAHDFLPVKAGMNWGNGCRRTGTGVRRKPGLRVILCCLESTVRKVNACSAEAPLGVQSSGVSRQIAFLVLLSLAARANTQRMSMGMVGGATLTAAFPNQTYSVSSPFATGIRTYPPFKDYVAGARVQVRITGRWSLLADGLYREKQGTWAAVLSDGTLRSVSPSPVVTW